MSFNEVIAKNYFVITSFFCLDLHKIQKKSQGGRHMNDYGKAVLEQYELEVESVKRGRGSLICSTNDGLKKLQEYHGSKSHLEVEQQVLLSMKNQSEFLVDCYVRNKEGVLYSVHPSQTTYVLKDWIDGNECSRNNGEELAVTVAMLAKMHLLLRQDMLSQEIKDKITICPPLLSDYERHLKEMKRVRQYVRNKKKKNEFEKFLMDTCNEPIKQAEESLKQLKQSKYMEMYEQAKEKIWISHGSFHYHNVLFSGKQVMITNFEKCGVQVQLVDLYLFMRKVLEKNNWDKELGCRMLEAYDRVLPLSEEELQVLGILFSYPEKYWKQMNFYYNRKKNWIPQQMLEKLQKTARQQEQIQGFVRIGLGK